MHELRFKTRLDRPVISLARVILWPLLFDEGFIEAKVVANAILPATVVGFAIMGEGVRYPLIDLS